MTHRLLPMVGAALLSCTTPAHARHQPVENGLPCVEELCVDADLSSVLDLPWSALNIAPPALGEPPVSDLLRGDDEVLRIVSAYWPGHVFDAQGLKALSQVKAVCREISVRERPRAEFMSADGQRTQVVFEPEPSADGASVVFRVAEIVRHAPAGAAPDDLAAWRQAVHHRYAGLSRYASTEAPGAQWWSGKPLGPALILVAPVGNPQERAADLSRQAPCRTD